MNVYNYNICIAFARLGTRIIILSEGSVLLYLIIFEKIIVFSNKYLLLVLSCYTMRS